MAYRPVRKAGLLIPSGSHRNPDALHLHVILTDKCADGFQLLGSIASGKRGRRHDPTCIIEPGEHRFITHRSYVVYRRFSTTAASHITKCVDGWVYFKHDPVTDELYGRMCDGITISEFPPRRIIDYWEENRP